MLPSGLAGAIVAGGTVLIPTEGLPFPPLQWEVPLGSAAIWGSFTATPTYSGAPIVATFSGVDPDPSNYSVSISWGDGSPLAPGTVQPDGDGGFWALGAWTYFAFGAYQVQVSITDSDGGTAGAQSAAFVLDDILETSGTSVSATEGALFSGAIATFTGPSPRPNSYVIAIDWGDGTSGSGRSVAGVAPGFAAQGDHTYPRAGTFTLTATVTYYSEDINVPPDRSVAFSTVTVSDAPLVGVDGGSFQAFLGVPYTGAVALFVDANPYGTWGDYAATIDWGDGVDSAADRIAPVDGGFAVLGSHTYGQLGVFPVGVAIIDGAGSSTLAASNATVVSALDAGPPPDAGTPDGGMIGFDDDGGFLPSGDGGTSAASGGCGCGPASKAPSGTLLLLGAALLMLGWTPRRTRRW